MRILAPFLFLALLLSSCDSEWMLNQTKGRYLRQFEHFVAKVEQESPQYQTDADWQVVEERFTELSEETFERYRTVLTEEELSQINRLRGKYAALQVKYLKRRGKEQLKNAIESGKEFLKELTE